MTRRKRTLLAVGLLIVLAGVGVAWMISSRPRLTFTAYQQIQAGMSVADVMAILGPGAEGRVLAAGGNVRDRQVELLAPSVRVAAMRIWEEKGTLITIGLSAEETVVYKVFQPPPPAGRAWLDRLHRWLGF
ncbi:MAG TPA: hypothetical protein VNX28_17085 [Gemmataceae bacterium]|jgi:hypothetical protein|nr:hypothetical protein [Gemmataceae bacterium]